MFSNGLIVLILESSVVYGHTPHFPFADVDLFFFHIPSKRLCMSIWNCSIIHKRAVSSSTLLTSYEKKIVNIFF